MPRANDECLEQTPRLWKRLEQAEASIDAGKGIRLEDVEDLAAFEERASEPDLAFEDVVKTLMERHPANGHGR